MIRDINERITELLYKKLKGGKLSTDEENELNTWKGKSEHNRLVYEELMNEPSLVEAINEYYVPGKQIGLLKLRQELFNKEVPPVHQPKNRRFNKWLSYSAAAIIVLAAGTFYLRNLSSINHNKPYPFSQQVSQVVNFTAQQMRELFTRDVIPGGDKKAILTLSDGATINLDSMPQGTFTVSSGIKLQKQGNKITYLDNGPAKAATGEMMYNIISVSRGGRYEVKLLDGTEIALNAVSRVMVPVSFASTERVVQLIGEAVFTVAKDKTRPFRVKVLTDLADQNPMQVEALRTKFNIAAYKDEKTFVTTLMEGSVRVTHDSKEVILKPGEQAFLSETKNVSVKKNADYLNVLSWRNGKYFYSAASIETIMRQAARIYDVDVKFEETNSRIFRNIEIDQSQPITELLETLSDIKGAAFNVKGRSVLVKLPKPPAKSQS